MTYLSQAHIVSKASSLEGASLLFSHPRNTNDLMSHERNLHARKDIVEILQTKLREILNDTDILIERLGVSSNLDELVDTRERKGLLESVRRSS